jgi:hypothetical protein
MFRTILEEATMLSARAMLLSVVIATAAAARVNGYQTALRDPRPEPAIPAILAALDTFRVVAIGDYHGTKDILDFIFSLVRHPDFPRKVTDIVVESKTGAGLSSALQPILDRYIRGESVSDSEARELWRVREPPGTNEFHAQFFPLVRRINQGLPAAARIRVLAGEPPNEPAWMNDGMLDRPRHIAGVIEREVLAKNRRAVMFYGAGHLRRGAELAAVTRWEPRYPGLTFIIAPYVGGTERGACGLPVRIGGVNLDASMAAWPVPSLARTRDTWLADLARAQTATPPGVPGFKYVDMGPPYDAYLYLGPPRLLLATRPPMYAQDSSGLKCPRASVRGGTTARSARGGAR